MTTTQDLEYVERFAGKRVVVTGGAGFIGSNLVRKLALFGASVVVIDALTERGGGNIFNLSDIDKNVEIHKVDLLNETAIPTLLQNQDFLFHLAGQTSHMDSVRFPIADLEVNAKAMLILMEACKQASSGVHVIYASTRQVYGKAQRLPVDETHPLDPPDFNAVHKIAAESYLQLFHRLYGITSTTLRLTNTFGPRMRVKDALQMFLGIWIRNLLEGRPIEIFGDGLQRRDFNHVDDVVDALLRGAGVRDAATCFNLGAVDSIALKDVAAIMTTLVPSGSFSIVPFPSDRKAIDIGDFQGDYSRFTAATGWHPMVAFADGLRETIQYFSTNRKHYW